ncbi:MAG: ATP-dependent DNA helicase UvrD2 [Acidimicrobiales bacterium]
MAPERVLAPSTSGHAGAPLRSGHAGRPLRSGHAGRLLDGLDPAQREAVTTEASPLCVMAGAGSGKTRVLTHRIAHRVLTGSALPAHVLALTFTRRAAGELGRRLAELGVGDKLATGTFHATAWAELRRHWADGGEWAPTLLDRKGRLLQPLVDGNEAAPADLATEIEWAKARMVGPEGYEDAVAAAARRPPLPAAAVADLYLAYEAEKQRRGLVDFDDLVLRCAEALETDTAFAAASRWRFRHLFVDEFQDVNPAQFRLLEAWRGDRSDLCIVGDPDQAIYAWNGADPGYLTELGRRMEGATVVHLDRNYRSTPQVIAVANAVLHGRRARGAHDLVPTTSDGPVPTVASFPTDSDEAAGVAAALRRLHGDGRMWSEQAVLARTRAQLVVLQEALATAGVPCHVRGAPEPQGPSGPLSGGSTSAGASVESLEACWRPADDVDNDGEAVTLATFHAAKGLEWPVVFLAGLEHGLVPVARAVTPEARAEERRLLYVAITRASQELHCSWAERRRFATSTVGRAPSPWLATVEAVISALADARDSSGTIDWRHHLDRTRDRARAPDGSRPAWPERSSRGPRGGVEVGERADPGVLAALRSWRADAARAAGVPAFVVLHDSTLAIVAEAEPRDRVSLLAVPGLGPVKAERYGDALLAVVASAVAS